MLIAEGSPSGLGADGIGVAHEPVFLPGDPGRFRSRISLQRSGTRNPAGRKRVFAEYLLQRHRFPQEEPLSQGALRLGEQRFLIFRFDSLGDDGPFHGFQKRDDTLQHLSTVLCLA